MLLVYKVIPQSRFTVVLLIVGGIYFANQVYTIYGGDAGDLVSAIVSSGIPHPPGYPLYTLLGVLLHKFIRIGTAAWKVGFLSSIPAILTLFFLFDLLFYLTKRRAISLISVLVLAFSYPFWLYSVVAEVFSLNNLFTVVLLWSFFHFAREGKKKYLYLGFFIFGLSLTHHHIILFLVPALFFLAFQKRKLLTRKNIFVGLSLLLAGLTPYLYVFIAANGNSPINWMGTPTLSNFIQLVTRATYGTFKAGAFIANQPFLRLLNLYGFWDFAYKDFRMLGVILFLLGAFYLLKRERKIFFTLIIGFASYLFFLFYASFPLAENFIVGTFERFVLPLYIFITFFITYGLTGLISVFEKYSANFLSAGKKNIVLNSILIIFLIYPFGLLLLNYPKISILKNDFTAENFASDLLNSVPENSIILIAIDTPLFNSQYLYFTQNKWPTVKLLHFGKLINPNLNYQLHKTYPELMLPDNTNPAVNDRFISFIDQNYGKFPIFSKQAYALEDGSWVPWGVLFRYYKNNDLPKDQYILEENRKLWDTFQDPMGESLSRFKNLLLADIIRMYTMAHQEIGFWTAKKGFNIDAEEHLLAAEKLTPDDLDSYNILAQVYIQQNKCDEAKKQIDFRIAKDPDDSSSYLLMSINYAVCYKDATGTSYFQKLYEEKQKNKETPLKKL